MLKPLITHKSNEARPDVLRARRIYGLAYGFSLALGFALWTWGVDGLILSRANVVAPWFKFIAGALICLPVGTLAGWLTMRFERGLFAALFWLGAAVVFAWASVALPFQLGPQWLAANNELPIPPPPTLFETLYIRVSVAYAWVAIFVLIAGLLELPLGEAAAFSGSLFGRIGPSFLAIALMGIASFMVDNLNNVPFREPLTLTDQTIQFVSDNLGRDVDPKLARAMHVSALRTITDLVEKPRKLLIGEYDQELGLIHVLVRFEDEWVDCLTVYGQVSNCGRLEP